MACYFDHTIKWIKKAIDKDESVNVVVHCMCNINRSSSIIIAYLMVI